MAVDVVVLLVLQVQVPAARRPLPVESLTPLRHRARRFVYLMNRTTEIVKTQLNAYQQQIKLKLTRTTYQVIHTGLGRRGAWDVYRRTHRTHGLYS